MNLLYQLSLAVLYFGIPVAVWLTIDWYIRLWFAQEAGILPKD